MGHRPLSDVKLFVLPTKERVGETKKIIDQKTNENSTVNNCQRSYVEAVKNITRGSEIKEFGDSGVNVRGKLTLL